MQFLLPPWDRNRPRIHPPMADSIVSVGYKAFALRAQNGLLFFRATDDLAKTWAIATPLTPELEADVAGRDAFFLREFEGGNIARYIVHQSSYLDRTVPLFFRGDGTGWCRESWNRDDIPFSHSVSMHVLLEGDDQNVQGDIGGVENQLHSQLSALDFPDDVSWGDHEENVEWMCGSRAELEKVLGWICDVETPFWEEDKWADAELSVATENPFIRAHITLIKVGGDELSIDADSNSDELSLDYGFDARPLPSRRFWTLCDLALDENTPLGTYWEYHDYGMGRCADDPNPMWLTFKLERPTPQKMGASRDELRLWLHGKVPSGEIETILGDDTPGEFPKTEW